MSCSDGAGSTAPVARTSDPPGDVTLGTYQAAAALYCQHSAPPSPPLLDYLDDVAERVGRGRVLEMGSGPGHDADYLESHGLQVVRTDATAAFVEMLRGAGHDARVLDVRVDDLGGPYDAVMANAVLLHLTRPEFVEVLRRARGAVRDGGLLAVTLKEGDGSAWSDAKLGLPRHFTYWREAGVRAGLQETGWEVLSLTHAHGRTEPWLFVLARAVLDTEPG